MYYSTVSLLCSHVSETMQLLFYDNFGKCTPLLIIISLSLSVLMAIFQVNLGYPVFIEAKDDGGGGDNWSYKSCKALVKSSPPTNQHNFTTEFK